MDLHLDATIIRSAKSGSDWITNKLQVHKCQKMWRRCSVAYGAGRIGRAVSSGPHLLSTLDYDRHKDLPFFICGSPPGGRVF